MISLAELARSEGVNERTARAVRKRIDVGTITPEGWVVTEAEWQQIKQAKRAHRGRPSNEVINAESVN